MSMKKDIFKIPNLLSLSRIFFAPLAFFLFQWQSLAGQIITLVFFTLVFLTDFFDGYLARKLNQQSELGRILDPLADKIIVFILLAALVMFRGVPWWVFLTIGLRDLFILVGGLFIKIKTGKVMESNIWGKAGTFIMMASMVLFIFPDLWFLSLPLLVISFVLIIISFYTYVYQFFGIFITSLKWRVILICLVIIFSLSILLIPFSYAPEIKQKDFSKTGVTLDTEQSMLLLEGYAPVIYLTQDDPYIPIDVKAYLDHAELFESNGFLGAFDKKVSSAPLNFLSSTLEPGKKYYTRLAQPPDIISAAFANEYEKMVYARACQTPQGIILQYWFFFLGSEAGDTGMLVHEADWEMIMIRLDQNQQPVEAGYSSHYYGFVKNYNDLEKENNRPVVYIAKGGHGSYFTKGIHKAYFDNHKLLRLGSDRTSSEIRMDLEVYRLKILSDSISWIQYHGYWGPPLFSLMRGPAFRSPHNQELNIWSFPDKWLDFYR
ncbi:MAG: CDP-alcohol phosphatidyltransferase family protein [Spirochaetales bacterium]|nr:CDP-alcohol phosphatidyltransferase family protein [Spirochaetales bacterium]